MCCGPPRNRGSAGASVTRRVRRSERKSGAQLNVSGRRNSAVPHSERRTGDIGIEPAKDMHVKRIEAVRPCRTILARGYVDRLRHAEIHVVERKAAEVGHPRAGTIDEP